MNWLCQVFGHDWTEWTKAIFFKNTTDFKTQHGFSRWCRRCQQQEWK